MGQLTGCQRHLMAALKSLRLCLAVIQEGSPDLAQLWGEGVEAGQRKGNAF